MLLDDVVAREPGVVEPVADLVLHVRLLGVGGDIPQAAHVPVDAARDHLADVALLDAVDALEVALLVAALRARGDLELLAAALRRALHEAAHAGAVDGHGLLAEHMLALGSGLPEVDRAEAGRRGEDGDVAVGGAGLLVGVEAGEDPVGRERLHAVLGERVAGAHRAFLEEIGEGHDLDGAARLLAGVDGVEHRARAASAAADDGDLERALAHEMGGGAACTKEDGRCRCGGDEGATVEVHRILLCCARRARCHHCFSHTTRKPTKPPLEYHHLLLGNCGSISFHSTGLHGRNAPQPRSAIESR